MSYCPSCKAEYVEDAIECPDCNVGLVASLPIEEQEDDFDWVPLRGVPGKTYAEMVTEILDKEEIPNYIKSDPLSTAYLTAGASAISGNATIYVPEKHQEKAEEILFQILDHI